LLKRKGKERERKANRKGKENNNENNSNFTFPYKKYRGGGERSEPQGRRRAERAAAGDTNPQREP
jgi:hypothetical protein